MSPPAEWLCVPLAMHTASDITAGSYGNIRYVSFCPPIIADFVFRSLPRAHLHLWFGGGGGGAILPQCKCIAFNVWDIIQILR